MARLNVKKTITKERRAKSGVDGDVCSTHGKNRKAEYLVDDGSGGMCCSPGDECKESKETSGGKPERKRGGKTAKECKWCEQGECWSHGQIEKPGKTDVDGDVCSAHGKTRKAEYLIDDGSGGMCCAPGDECKEAKGTPAGKPERKRRGKNVDAEECKWCEQGECWTHGQIEKPEQKKTNKGGKGKGKTPSPAMVKAAIQIMQMAKGGKGGSKKGGKGRR